MSFGIPGAPVDVGGAEVISSQSDSSSDSET